MADVNTSGQPDTNLYGQLLQKPMGPLEAQQSYANLAQTRAQTGLINQEVINKQTQVEQTQLQMQLTRLDQVNKTAAGLLGQYAGQGGVPQEAMTKAITELRANGAIPGPMAATLLQQITGDPAHNYQQLQLFAARGMQVADTLRLSATPQNDTTGYQSLYGTQGGIMGPAGQFGRFTPGSAVDKAQTTGPTGRVNPQTGQPEYGTDQQKQDLASGRNGTGVSQLPGVPGQPQTSALPPVGQNPGREGHGYTGGLGAGVDKAYQDSVAEYQKDLTNAGSQDYQNTVSAYKQVLSDIDKADVGQTSDAKSWLRNFVSSTFPESWKEAMHWNDQDKIEVAFEKIQKYLSRAEIGSGKQDSFRGTSYQLDKEHLANPNVKNVKEALKDLVRFNMAQTQFQTAVPHAYLAEHSGDQQDALAKAGPQYSKFKADFNQKYDPRAVYYASLSPQEQKAWMAEYGSKLDKAEKDKFIATMKLLRDRVPQLGYNQP